MSNNYAEHYVSEVLIYPDEPVPGEVEIMLNDGENWFLGVKGIQSKGDVLRFIIPDEKYSKYIKINFLSNKRGGSFVGIRYLQVKGLLKKDIPNILPDLN